ncbi:hypothetical protein Q0590_00380 [Rhodocytophaga aerolata]|uniref:Uncharacterized protein n=1 Tax=Rhodocytophaga aerolata TaxID=455078 RepID=A0ABT8QXW2_9BACT|nr:hypothetical protein [Rhodocytophaga aerolata]MDO1444680.1 hypothetical protein [Rhodocytophaga aerolata]
MFTSEPISQQTPSFPTTETAPDRIQSCDSASAIVKKSADSLHIGRCMQLIWNEVDRLTVLGVIRTEEDKWFFAYRKAIRILSGDE